MNRLIVFWGLLILTATGLSAQGQVTRHYERVLIPVAIGVPGQVPGAYGSIWKTELIGRNESDEVVRVWPDPRPCIIPCPAGESPHSTFTPEYGGRGEGMLLWVKKPGNEKVFFNLRVYDASRSELTWGTELPVIRESEAFTGPSQLLNIPIEPGFRQSLRIYDIDPEKAPPAKEVLLQIYSLDSNVPIVSRQFAVVDRVLGISPEYSNPLQREMNLALSFPEILSFDRIRIEISPLSNNLRYWAFVSITNNLTQQVSTITPQ